jgi:hypothetical protein
MIAMRNPTRLEMERLSESGRKRDSSQAGFGASGRGREWAELHGIGRELAHVTVEVGDSDLECARAEAQCEVEVDLRRTAQSIMLYAVATCRTLLQHAVGRSARSPSRQQLRRLQRAAGCAATHSAGATTHSVSATSCKQNT